MTFEVFPLENGAQLGYQVLGTEHLNRNIRPLVLINGMSMRYEDWDTISKPLSKLRPVLVFDHRDIGASIVKTSKREDISINSMTADLISLLRYLGFENIDACGWSMGGVILQRLLILSAAPGALPFRVHHALLTATTTKTPRGDPEFIEYLSNPPRFPGPLTDEKKMLMARPMVELSYDVDFLRTPEGKAKVEKMLPSMIVKRPYSQITRQGQSVRNADTRPFLPSIPSSTLIMIVHGTKDRVIHYAESNYLTKHVKHAVRVVTDPSRKIPGSVPSTDYGHSWYEYFEPQVWVDVIQTFTKGGIGIKEGKAKM